MPRNPTVFVVEVPVTESMVRLAIESNTYGLGHYHDEHYLAAGLRKKKIRAALAADATVINSLKKLLTGAARERINMELEDDMWDLNHHPILKDAFKRLDHAVDDLDTQADEERERQRVREATELLRRSGFKVTRD